MSDLQVIVVTPERTAFDETADFVVVPLYDGELGILPGHARLIGRLNLGEMRIRSGAATDSYYVEGGFVEVSDNVVSVITGRAVPAAKLNAADLRGQLDVLELRTASQPTLSPADATAVKQLKAQIRLAESHGVPSR